MSGMNGGFDLNNVNTWGRNQTYGTSDASGNTNWDHMDRRHLTLVVNFPVVDLQDGLTNNGDRWGRPAGLALLQQVLAGSCPCLVVDQALLDMR